MSSNTPDDTRQHVTAARQFRPTPSLEAEERKSPVKAALTTAESRRSKPCGGTQSITPPPALERAKACRRRSPGIAGDVIAAAVALCCEPAQRIAENDHTGAMLYSNGCTIVPLNLSLLLSRASVENLPLTVPRSKRCDGRERLRSDKAFEVLQSVHAAAGTRG
jgi:hypothetical protein